MTILTFQHRGWTVTTAAWSAAAKNDVTVEICYQWGADWISWVDSATGIARVALKMNMGEFNKRVARGGVVDLTAHIV